MAQDTPPKESKHSEEPLFVRVWEETSRAKEEEHKLSQQIGDKSDSIE